MDRLEREVERHMRCFRDHGDMGPSVLSAQFLALLVVMLVDQLSAKRVPKPVVEDCMRFMTDAIGELDKISPGYAVLLLDLLGSAMGPLGQPRPRKDT
jgi:hypothetical protein